jgi:hypothetical protein
MILGPYGVHREQQLRHCDNDTYMPLYNVLYGVDNEQLLRRHPFYVNSVQTLQKIHNLFEK